MGVFLKERKIHDRNQDDIVQFWVLPTDIQLPRVALGGVIDNTVGKPLHILHLHFHQVLHAPLVRASNIHDGLLLDGKVAFPIGVFNLDDPTSCSPVSFRDALIKLINTLSESLLPKIRLKAKSVLGSIKFHMSQSNSRSS